MPNLITTLGPKRADELGMILPHEHVFVDLRTPDARPRPGERGRRDRADGAGDREIQAPASPRWSNARRRRRPARRHPAGRLRGDRLADRRADRHLPRAVGAGLGPRGQRGCVGAWMLRELHGQIERSGVQAGWIKLSAGDDGITPCEAKILRAARAHRGNRRDHRQPHHPRPRRARPARHHRAQRPYAAALHLDPRQGEEDFAINLEMARRGAWIEYDWIGGGKNDQLYSIAPAHARRRVRRPADAQHGPRLVRSGPARRRHAKPFTYLTEVFLPKLPRPASTLRRSAC